jgi:hypothetical protein
MMSLFRYATIDKNPQRSFQCVPLPILCSLLLFLILQIYIETFSYSIEKNIPPLPQPPTKMIAKLSALGDEKIYYALGLLWLQQYDRNNGQSLSYHTLNYHTLAQWLSLFTQLSPESEYPFVLAVRNYGAVFNTDKQNIMFDWVESQFPKAPLARWRWLAESIVQIKHHHKDHQRALKKANLLYEHTHSLDIPYWAKDLKIILMADLNEREALKIFIAGLIESGVIKDENERAFLIQRFEALDQASQKPSSQP